MLFSSPTGSSTAFIARKRRALPASEVTLAIVKSSSVPISSAEAHESLKLLTSLCPFFLREMNIAGEEWFEMPAPATATSSSTTESMEESPNKLAAHRSSPHVKNESAQVLNRSPKRVKWEEGGLRDVREIIRKEVEIRD